jgi:hypothetical protein
LRYSIREPARRRELGTKVKQGRAIQQISLLHSNTRTRQRSMSFSRIGDDCTKAHRSKRAILPLRDHLFRKIYKLYLSGYIDNLAATSYA